MFGFLVLAPYARTTRYEEAFLPNGIYGLGRFAPSALPHYKYRFFAKLKILARPRMLTKSKVEERL